MENLLLALSVAAMLLAFHPFTTYPLSLRLIRALGGKRPIALASGDDSRLPSVSLCVCAYNEEKVIVQKAENMLALRESLPGLQILVYVDASSDRTAEMLAPYADRMTVINGTERMGKTFGMNRLVSMATGDILVFTDANVMMEKDSLANLRRYFVDEDVGCVCGHLLYVNTHSSATAETNALYWRLEEQLKQFETDTGSVMTADGSLFALRRHLHRSVPVDLCDDMYLSMSTLCDGYRVIRAPDVRATEEGVAQSAEEFRRKIRIACLAFNVHRQLWPQLRQLNPLDFYKYVSHKLLRWVAIYSLAASVIFFLAGLLEAGQPVLATAAAIGGLIMVILGALGVPGAAKPYQILLALLGTGIGVWRSLRGVQYQTWTPASSRVN